LAETAVREAKGRLEKNASAFFDLAAVEPDAEGQIPCGFLNLSAVYPEIIVLKRFRFFDLVHHEKYRQIATIPGHWWPLFDKCKYFRRGCRFLRKGQGPEKGRMAATIFKDESVHVMNGESRK